MKHIKESLTLLLLLSGLLSTTTPLAADKDSACSIPTSQLSNQDETAWRIFVAINCKEDGNLTWENWQTQACINDPNDCNTGRLKGSLLRDKNAPTDDPRRTQGCSPMTVKSPDNPSLNPFVPSNLSENPVFCEEVVINPAEEAYAMKHGLLTQTGQVKYLETGSAIDFPTDALEVKADWVPASSFTNANFDCSKPNSKIYLEMIEGTCYALAGMHISSKLYTNWLWATFEPQYNITNPNRCDPELYGLCSDSWGANPSVSTGQNTKPTKNLARLFKDAGKALHPAFKNYRLTGTQTSFDQPTAAVGNLGSSFVEFNAQVPVHEASCITCHSYAQRQFMPASGITSQGGPPQNDHSTGQPKTKQIQLPVPYKSLDFSWFLGVGVPQTNSCHDFNAGPILNGQEAEAKCPNTCADVARVWNNQWDTIKPGTASVCGCCLE